MRGSYGKVEFNYSGKEIFNRRSGNRLMFPVEIPRFRETISNQILAALPAEELAKLLPFAESADFSAGENIYQPDDKVRYVYFPETTVFSQLQILEDGNTSEVGMVGSEGVIGLQAIIGFPTANCWTETRVAGRALKISTEIINREFNGNGSLRAQILGYLNAYIEQIFQKAVCNSHHRLKERFCNWLLMLQDRKKSNKFSLTQEQIARVMGVNRPSFSCIALELRQKGIIHYSRGKIVILDRQALEKAACSCYSGEIKNAFFINNFKKSLKLIAA